MLVEEALELANRRIFEVQQRFTFDISLLSNDEKAILRKWRKECSFCNNSGIIQLRDRLIGRCRCWFVQHFALFLEYSRLGSRHIAFPYWQWRINRRDIHRVNVIMGHSVRLVEYIMGMGLVGDGGRVYAFNSLNDIVQEYDEETSRFGKWDGEFDVAILNFSTGYDDYVEIKRYLKSLLEHGVMLIGRDDWTNLFLELEVERYIDSSDIIPRIKRFSLIGSGEPVFVPVNKAVDYTDDKLVLASLNFFDPAILADKRQLRLSCDYIYPKQVRV